MSEQFGQQMAPGARRPERIRGEHYVEQCRHGYVVRRCRCLGPHQVRIVDCPDACVLARHRGAPDVYEEAHLLLVTHQRFDAGGCLCGWDELGRSHARHVLDQLLAAGWTPPRATPQVQVPGDSCRRGTDEER